MMRCREARPELPDFVRGRSDEETNRRLSSHLDGCPACTRDAQELKALFPRIDEGQPWAPAGSYWTSILPRVHQRLEENAARVLPQWTTRFALPVAAAIVLAAAVIKIAPQTGEDYPENFSALLEQLTPDELQGVSDQQAVSEILQPALEEPSATSSDLEEVKAILGEDGIGAGSTDADITAGTEDLSDQDAGLLLPSLSDTSR
ncbi:MAG TPA: zf-HC2 domain-containing protein [Bacteroidota bacterium]|nr:zf-HC2 domain-containing protein [Bacteroidota bacterium]